MRHVVLSSLLAIAAFGSACSRSPSDVGPTLGTLTGTVTLAGLYPAPPLTVTVSGPVFATTTTTASGAYAFDALPLGEYQVSVAEEYTVEGSASAAVRVTSGSSSAPPLLLTPTGRVRGRIVLTRTPPLAGVPVTRRTSPAGAVVDSTTTDADGAFVFPPRLLGNYTISASVPSTAESTLTAPVHLAFGMNTAPDLVFTALGGLDGTVTLAGQGGAARAVVWVQGTNRAVLTDDAGAFAVPALPAGTYTLSASLAGWGTSATLLDVGYATTTSAALVLQARSPGQPGTSRLSGRASVLGLGPRAGITVSVDATSLSTVTAADGSWTITGVADGAWPLTLTDGVRVEHVPAALALPGSDGFLLDGMLYPIGEIELQDALRVTSLTTGFRQLTSDGHLLVLDGTDLLSAPLGGGPVVRIATDVQRFQASSAATGPRSWVAVFGKDGTVSAVPASGGPAIPIANLTFVEFDPTGEVLMGLAADGSLWYAALERADVRPVAHGWTNGFFLPDHFTFTDPSTDAAGTVEYATGNVAMWGAVSICDVRLAAGGRVVVKEMGSGPCYGRVLVGLPGAALTVISPASSVRLNLNHSVSPDGRFVTVNSYDQATRNEGLILASTVDGRVLRSEPDGFFLEWAPDSAHLTWRHLTGTGDVNLATSADGTSSPLGRGTGQLFSPDGAYLSLSDGTAVKAFATRDGTLVAQLPGNSQPFAFSPDSRFLVTSGASIQTLDLVNGTVTFVSSTLYATSIHLSPDGERLLFFSDAGLSSAPISGAPVTLLVPSTNVGVTRILEPTDAVLFESIDGFHLVPVEGGTIQDLGARGPDFFPTPSISADGLSVAQLDGAGVLRAAALPAGTPGIVDTGASAYQRCDGGLLIWHSDKSLSVAPPTGTATPVGTGVTSWSTAPGGWVIFTDGEGRLFTAVVPTGATSLLATDVSASTWLGGAIRGDRIAVVSGDVLQSAAVSGGPLTPHVRVGPDCQFLWSCQFPWSWLDDRHGVAIRTGAPAPYRFQNGLYLVTVR